MSPYFVVVFVSQIAILSFYHPKKLAETVLRNFSDVPDDEVASQGQISGRLLLYTAANWLVITLGLVLVTMFFVADVFESLRLILLVTGAYFLFQLAPLVLIGNLLGGRVSHASTEPDPNDPPTATRLFDFVSPVFVGVAGVLFIAYIATHFPSLQGGWSAQVAKVLIYTSTNLFLAATVGWNLAALGRERGETRVKRIHYLEKIAPTFVAVSIGISLYYFGKDVILHLGVAQVRPVMMSVFLQGLGTLAYSKIIARGLEGEEDQADRHSLS